MTEQILTVVPAPAAEPVAVLAAAGEIDHDSRDVLAEAAAAVLRNGHDRLVLDLSGVSFCDSGGLSLFLDLHRDTTARGGSLRLACVQPPVLAVIHATNLDRLLPMDATVEDAVRAATAGGPAWWATTAWASRRSVSGAGRPAPACRSTRSARRSRPNRSPPFARASVTPSV